ncbi:helix-turn-helix domain-containing protein [Winogradskyella aquimaris]|jgi:transcriptional regulator with XRE-family HTH domain|uniref:Helix-turn-helix transcriptional regulator n=1 Tax=Winogradskyella aquimaris TaxID=864074 RepID=A0ABU5EII0_9FLAO|nr:helix-turn-helix transcriptional regulator [Winogradskyella aquimaris]MDY2586105.1 helix-turn-helix transcriptional regulator [Winogradskyella aquimaris]
MVNQFILKEFGNRIRFLRNQKNLSQEELSFITGFHRTYIGMIERGERNISLTNILVFAKAFEMDVSKLLDFQEQNSKINYKDYQFKN